jgi:hypothetical protein
LCSDSLEENQMISYLSQISGGIVTISWVVFILYRT